MAYKVIILYRLYMPSYVLGTFTEYPYNKMALSLLNTSVNFYRKIKIKHRIGIIRFKNIFKRSLKYCQE